MASDPLATSATRLAPLAAEPGQPVVQHQISRVLILDDADRAYLLHGHDPNGPAEPHWFTVGDRIADGETPREAACRVLTAQLGIQRTPDVFDQPIWCSTSRFSTGGVTYRHYQRFFHLRLPEQQHVALRAPHASAARACRWWTIAELERSDEPLDPPELPELLRRLTASA